MFFLVHADVPGIQGDVVGNIGVREYRRSADAAYEYVAPVRMQRLFQRGFALR